MQISPETLLRKDGPKLVPMSINISAPEVIEQRRLKEQYERFIFLAPTARIDVSWLNKAKMNISYTYYKRDPLCEDSPRNIVPNYGNEASVYIRFILDNYDHYLPDYTAFLHGHETSWHSELMVQILDGFFWGKHPFMNLNFNFGRHKDTSWPNLWHRIYVPDIIPQWWDYLFGDILDKGPTTSYCCAQFVVSKERIREVPKEIWQRWYDWLLAEKVESSRSSRAFEHSWPSIFGEPQNAPAYPEGMCYITRCSKPDQELTKLRDRACEIPPGWEAKREYRC